MQGVVSVRNLEFQGKHGYSAAERKSARRFQVDVDLRVELDRAVATDRLADTVDYHEVCRIVVEIGEGGPYRLLEATAGKMLTTLSQRWPAAKIAVELRKLHPPCPGNPSHTSVRVESE
ncbi:MAG: dihydroneopterin aldolase [Polyangia bacterium]